MCRVRVSFDGAARQRERTFPDLGRIENLDAVAHRQKLAGNLVRPVGRDPQPIPALGVGAIEALGLLAVTIYLSMIAADSVDETAIRFAAGGCIILAILAASASRRVRRRRNSGWTLAAILQVIVAIGTGAAVLVAEWHPLLTIGFAFPTLIMLVLSTGELRRELGQA